MSETLGPTREILGHPLPEIQEFLGEDWEVRSGHHAFSIHYPNRSESARKRILYKFDLYFSTRPHKPASIMVKLGRLLSFTSPIKSNIELLTITDEKEGEAEASRVFKIPNILEINLKTLAIDMHHDDYKSIVNIEDGIDLANRCGRQ